MMIELFLAINSDIYVTNTWNVNIYLNQENDKWLIH